MSFESEKIEDSEDENLVKNEEALAYGEVTPKDRLQKQIQLATSLYEKINGQIDHERFHNDLNFRNKIMEFWSSDSGCENKTYSKLYRELEESNWFKNHDEIKGDIKLITIDHFLEFLELKKQGLAS